MKLIFIKDVGGVARAGTVKEIADGYALNFLIPRGCAVQATPAALEKHAKHMKEVGEQHQKAHDELARLVQSLEGRRVEIRARTTDKGGLFKAISPADVVQALGVRVPPEAVHMQDHLKHTGEYPVRVQVADAKATLTVVVSAA